MSDKKLKIRYEDLDKLAKYLEKNCKGSYVTVQMSDTKVIFKSSTVVGKEIEISLSDDNYYMLPKIKTEDDL